MASIYRVGSKWRAQVRIKDKPPLSEMFTTKQAATAWAREQEGALHKTKGEDQFVTYSKLHDEYFAGLKECGDTKEKVCKYLKDYWGSYRLAEITANKISDYARKRTTDGVLPSTVLTDLVYFGVVLRHGGLITGNEEALRARDRLSGTVKALRNAKIVSESRRRSRRPTEEELLKLRDYFASKTRDSVPMWDLILFAIATCMRLGEIVGLGGIVWEDFEDNRKLLTIRGRKDPDDASGFDMTIPLLTGHVSIDKQIIDPVGIMRRQRSAATRRGRIFPHSENTVTYKVSVACKKLHIADLHFHDLRHDGISRMFVPGGYSIPEVAAVSGHKSWKNLQRYTQIRPEDLHR